MVKLTSLTMTVLAAVPPRAMTHRPSTSTRRVVSVHERQPRRVGRLSISRFTPMVSVAIATAGMITAGAPSTSPHVLAHQRAPVGVGRLHAEAEEAQAAQQQHDNTKRRPKSASTGCTMFGRISSRMMNRCPRRARARRVTKSSALMFDRQRARDAERARRVDDRGGQDQHRIDEPNAATTTRPNIRLGIEISASSTRLRTASTQPPRTAASRPAVTPARQASSVAASAMPTVYARAQQHPAQHVAAQIVGAERKRPAHRRRTRRRRDVAVGIRRDPRRRRSRQRRARTPRSAGRSRRRGGSGRTSRWRRCRSSVRSRGLDRIATMSASSTSSR